MIDLNTFILLGSVLLSSVWSLVCLEKNKPDLGSKSVLHSPAHFVGDARVNASGILTMTPPLEQLRAADF